MYYRLHFHFCTRGTYLPCQKVTSWCLFDMSEKSYRWKLSNLLVIYYDFSQFTWKSKHHTVRNVLHSVVCYLKITSQLHALNLNLNVIFEKIHQILVVNYAFKNTNQVLIHAISMTSRWRQLTIQINVIYINSFPIHWFIL